MKNYVIISLFREDSEERKQDATHTEGKDDLEGDFRCPDDTHHRHRFRDWCDCGSARWQFLALGLDHVRPVRR